MILGEIILWIVYIGLLPIGLILKYLDERNDGDLGWKGFISALLIAIWVGSTVVYLFSVFDWSLLIAWWNSEV